MPFKTVAKSRRRTGKSTVNAWNSKVSQSSGDATNAVEESEDLENFRTVLEASQVASVAENEITRQMEVLDGNLEEVDEVLSAIMEMDVNVKEEPPNDGKEDYVGNNSIKIVNVESDSEPITQNEGSLPNVEGEEDNLNLIGEFTEDNMDVVTERQSNCDFIGKRVVVEEKILNVNGQGENDKYNLDAVTAVEGLSSEVGYTVEDNKDLDITELENSALNGECVMDKYLDHNSNGNSHSCVKGVEGYANLDANLEDTSSVNGFEETQNLDGDGDVKNEKRKEKEGAKDACESDCSLDANLEDTSNVNGFEETQNLDGDVKNEKRGEKEGAKYASGGGSEQNSVEWGTSTAKTRDIQSPRHLDDMFSARDGRNGHEEIECEDHDKDEETEDMEEDNEDNNIEGEKKEEEDPLELLQDHLNDWKKQKKLEVYIEGLGKTAVKEDLIEVFGKFGELQAARLIKHPTRNNRKVAFIRYATVDQAKNALSELENGIKVKGKHVKVSGSQDNDTLLVSNICKWWTKKHVVEKLNCYGIEHIDDIRIPADPENEGKIKGFAFLKFRTHSDLMAAFLRLRKPDAVFGHSKSAKAAFVQIPLQPKHKITSEVKTVYVKRLTRSWDIKKLKEICKRYGEIKKVKLPLKFGTNRKNFGFIAFSSGESALACVEGINNGQFGGEMKVKAALAKPHCKGQLWKGTRGRFKVKFPAGLKMIINAKSWKATKENKRKKQANKLKGFKKRSRVAAEQKSGAPSKLENNNEGETVRPECIISKDQDAGVPSRPENLPQKMSGCRKRARGTDYSNRTLEKRQGSIRDEGRHSIIATRSKSYFTEAPVHGIHCVPWGTSHARAYIMSANSHIGCAQGIIYGSKKQNSDMEPHAGLLEPSWKQGRNHLQYVVPALGHQGQPHAGCLQFALRNQGQGHVGFLEPVLGNGGLPHAGYIEPGFGRRHFDASDYQLRRVGAYNGEDNRRPSYGRGSAVPSSYVPSHTSHTRYEHNGGVDGYQLRGIPQCLSQGTRLLHDGGVDVYHLSGIPHCLS